MSGIRGPGRDYRLLIGGLADPGRLLELNEDDWDRLIPLARSVRLFSRLAALAGRDGLLERLPPGVAIQMIAAARSAAHRQRKILWELGCLQTALEGIGVPVLVLKGTAYLIAGSRAGCGRVFGDVDLLVPRQAIAEVERTLRAAKWQAVPLDDYDQRYYREWMHEIPPMRHPERQIEVDIHHSIAPLTSRFGIDATPLFQAAAPVKGYRFQVPAAPDLILHSAIHLFYGGEFEHGLRDLSDLDLLLREFDARAPAFWETLAERADSLGLTRPLYYALRYAGRLFGTPIPASVLASARRYGPDPATARLMDAVLESALMPDFPSAGRRALWARWFLLMRSHILKMPAGLLLYHTWKKLTKAHPARG